MSSRSHPNTTGGTYYEVFTYSADGLVTTSAVSSDPAWDLADTNQRRRTISYVDEDGFWMRSVLSETYLSGAWAPIETVKYALHSQIVAGGAIFPLITEYEKHTKTGKTWTNFSQDTCIGSGTTAAPYRMRTYRLNSSDGSAYVYTDALNGLLCAMMTSAYEPRPIPANPFRELLRETSTSTAYWPRIDRSPATGLVLSRSLPNLSDATATSQTETFTYYPGTSLHAGRVLSRTSLRAPAGTTYYDYNESGQLKFQWGSGDYPVSYDYDTEGRMTKMNTYQTGTWTAATWPNPAASTAATTEWVYGGAAGSAFLNLISEKKYPAVTPAQNPVSYKYHPDGSLKTRTWQRGVITTYEYDGYSRLKKSSYTGGTVSTPTVEYTYNAAGRVENRTDAAGVTTTTYTGDGRTTSTDIPSAAHIDYGYDTEGCLSTLTPKWGAITSPTVTYNYFSSSIGLNGATSNHFNGFTAGTAPNQLDYRAYYTSYISDVPNDQIYNLNAAANLSTSSGYTFRRSSSLTAAGLINVVNHTGLNGTSQITLQSHTYTYNLDRVTAAKREDNISWSYTYDTKGQVYNASKTPGSMILPGSKSIYSYDHIGNRTTLQEGGDSAGNNLRTTNYGTANALNQYTSITHPQSFDVLGVRASSNPVDIYLNNSTTALSPGPTFSTSYQWRSEVAHTVPGIYDKVVVKEANITIEDGIQYTAPATESPTYDADGNLLTDGRWTYKWDGENRLVEMESAPQTTIPAVAGRKLTFTYDGLSRRIAKKVATRPNTTTAYTTTTDERYVYDGWNLVMTINALPATPVRVATYVWGPDLASSPYARRSWQRAGGVGGLLAVIGTQADNSDTYLPLSDRLGNITGYRRPAAASATALNNDLATTGAIYDYDAFGREFRSSGPAADTVPFHFSSKFTDVETGLNYYGYRYYDPGNGRWPSRDPIWERGGLNFYGMVKNDPVNRWDRLGLKDDFVKPGTVLPLKSCGGKITITQYEATPKGYQGNSTPGAVIYAKFEFDSNKECCCKGGDFKWISTVTKDTAPGQPATPYTDNPPGAKDPYYYTDQDIQANPGLSGPEQRLFGDAPSVDPSTLAKPVEIEFETCLVCAGENNKKLKCFKWGVTVTAGANGGAPVPVVK